MPTLQYQKPDAHLKLTAEQLSGWVKDAEAKPRYLEALRKSDFASMLNYYRANYPKPGARPMPAMPKVKAPVLMFHGLQDRALLPGALDGTWQWLEQDLTLVTVPGAGHFVQADAADTALAWLAIMHQPLLNLETNRGVGGDGCSVIDAGSNDSAPHPRALHQLQSMHQD